MGVSTDHLPKVQPIRSYGVEVSVGATLDGRIEGEGAGREAVTRNEDDD